LHVFTGRKMNKEAILSIIALGEDVELMAGGVMALPA
jgi:hypothetical protein